MRNIKERPYGLLLYTAIAFLIAPVFIPTIHIDFHDKTMFSISLAIIAWIFPLFLIFFWLLYLLTKRFLCSKAITWAHVLITVSTTIFFVILLYIGINPLPPASRSYYDTSLIDRHKLIGNITHIAFIIFVYGQCIYLVNVLLGFFRKNNKQHIANT